MRKRNSIPVLVFCLLLSSLAFDVHSEETNPTITMMLPGFQVRELPVQISNVNNLRFSPSGELTAVGYDGRIFLLEDTDGDGLEDKANIFWDKPTLTVPVGAFWAPEGLYISSHGKISLLSDTNGDGKADSEEVLSTNWPPTGTWTGNVDATAITKGKDGAIYFGLLTENYANPYLVDDGVAHYKLESKRGTIQKFDPKSKALQTIATGIRVPYQLAFNKLGDLFATDQEGETWCPNGNPLDELDHIVLGKNYGFPPRDPKYLPDLISEPPVVGFGPQHESTCGFVFNEPSAKQKLFGPPAWEDDALVAGESRGKIWRVPMVKTPFGYLGREILIARLRMLTTDVAISPKGDLYVSCQSGLPDWGTGPKGAGKIFKISYTDSAAPLPVIAWTANPMEVRIAFDKPINPAVTNSIGDIVIDFGEYVRPADRLENLKPPYKAVAEQEATPRGKLKVVSAGLSADQRTLILTTDPHPANVSYAVSIPSVLYKNHSGDLTTVDVGYDLHGVEVSWNSKTESKSGSKQEWSGWFPHLDSSANRLFTLDSAQHENFYSLSGQPGFLVYRTRISAPESAKRLRLERNKIFNLLSPADILVKAESNKFVAEIPISADGPLSLEISCETGIEDRPEFHVAYQNADDPTWRVLPFAAFNLPWAPDHKKLAPVQVANVKLEGGDYEKGRALFFGNELKCSTCHTIQSIGGKIGPDLSNLPHRDAASVLRDIQEPNATINPDFVSYNVTLNNGETLTGFLRAQTQSTLRLLEATGQEKIIPISNVVTQQVSAVSLMPSGLLEGRKEGEIKDLLTFLTNEKPQRDPEIVRKLLKLTGASAKDGDQSQPLKLVLIASKQDHGAGQHDYPHWQTNFHAFLAKAPNCTVENGWEWPSPEQFKTASCLIFYFWNHQWTPEQFAQIDEFQERGGALVMFHSATISDNAPEELAKRIGLAAEPVRVKYIHAPFELKFNSGNPITEGLTTLPFLDEPYWPMIGDTNKIQVLASANIEGAERPLIWTFKAGKGRVFASVPGHYTWTHEDPMFQVIELRGIAWATDQPLDRFLPLIQKSLSSDALKH